LTQWIDELAPGERKIRITQGSMVKFSQEQKKEAVISLCTNEASAATLAGLAMKVQLWSGFE